MTPVKAFELHTAMGRYTMTVYRLADGRYLAEYCAHLPDPGPLVRIGDLEPPTAGGVAHHETYYLKTLLRSCLSEIEREAGTVSHVQEIAPVHSQPGNECIDDAQASTN